MTVNIVHVVQEAVNRTIKRNGLMLMAVIFLLSILSGFVGLGIAQYTFNQQAPASGVQSVAPIAIPPLVGVILVLVIALANLVVSIAAIRVFVSDETERLPREYFTRNMGWAILNLIVGGIVFGIAVGLGFLLLIIPGLFLLVSLFFWSAFVAVEDQNFIEAFSSSWNLTKGHRLKLFLLGVVVFLITIAAGIIFSFGNIVGSFVGLFVTQIGTAVATVFSTAALAVAYNQLRASQTDSYTASEDEKTGPGPREDRTEII